MKTIRIIFLALTMLMSAPAYLHAENGPHEGRKVARKYQKWSVKGGKKTIKSFRGINKGKGKSNV